MEGTAAAQACGACGKPAPLKCSRCKKVYYCGAECQRGAWPAHKKECFSKQVSLKALVGTWSSPVHDCDNLMVFLHGFGDTEQPYVKLGQTMAVPNTACLSIRAPFPLLDLGYYWYPILDEEGAPILPTPSEKRRIAGLNHSVKLLGACMDELTRAGWKNENIFLIGFAQGGVVALDYGLSASKPVGGVASISGGCFLPECGLDVLSSRGWRNKDLPVFVSHGERDPAMPVAEARAQYAVLSSWMSKDRAAWKTYPKKTIMLSSADETRDLCAFLAPLLHSRSAALEAMARDGSLIEITPNMA